MGLEAASSEVAAVGTPEGVMSKETIMEEAEEEGEGKDNALEEEEEEAAKEEEEVAAVSCAPTTTRRRAVSPRAPSPRWRYFDRLPTRFVSSPCSGAKKPSTRCVSYPPRSTPRGTCCASWVARTPRCGLPRG